MGFDIGRLLGDLATGGGTYFKRRKKAKRQEREANEQIARNTAMAEELYNRDYGQSQWNNVQSDPALRASQNQALARLEGLSQTGFDDLDRQALEQGFVQSRQEEQGQRQAALSAAARRGDTSGGNALLASLMAQQGGANRASQQATNVGLAGRDRALQALESSGAMAGQMRSQDFGEQAQRAGGLDAFNQWATGQHSQDAQFLANARLGQASNLQAQAAQNMATPALDAGVNALATYYSGGLAGNVAGSGGGNTVSSSAKGMAGGPSMAQPDTAQGYQPPSGGGMQKGAQGYAARRRRNPTSSVQNVMSAMNNRSA